MNITMEQVLVSDSINTFYDLYLAAFDPLRTEAAARHLLSFEEFSSEMTDVRIDKYIVFDEEHSPIGMATLTTNLAAIPWISPEYYSTRYADANSRGALFYLGYILVGASRRRFETLMMLTDQINRTVSESSGVLGFDLCQKNDSEGIGRMALRLLGSSTNIKLLDTQNYYAADYR